MRRLTGLYDGVEHVILEYDNGMVECPSNIRDALADPAGRMPTGEALDDAGRVLFGDTLVIREL